jgi:Putative adhesin
MMRLAPALWLLSLCVLLATGCAGGFSERVHETVHQSIGGEPATVRIDNIAGSVHVEGAAKPAVEVEATKYGYDDAELRSIHVDARKEGDEVVIATSYESRTHGGGVRYRVTVPASAAVHIGNIAGAVDVRGVRGNVSVETQAGRIVADCGRVAGNRSVDLNATTGAIELTIARDSSASVEARSTVGHISSELPEIAERRENFVGANATGKIGAGDAHIRLTTTTGAIAIRTRS